MISKYFINLEDFLEGYRHIIEDYLINKQKFTREKGTIDGEIFFIDGSRLDFLEVVNTNIQTKGKYRYHYMNKANEMVFRCDNAKHYPGLKTFPHHKHVSNETVLENEEPYMRDILIEIEKLISR